MQRSILGLGALALSATTAMAGGLDRSGQNITSIFETGNYAELSFGYVTPDVTGNFAGLFESGNVGPAYSQLSFAVKTDLNPKISIGLIVDQPYGAEVNYADVGYVLGGTTATVDSTAITLLGRYKFSDAFSVHAGLREVTLNGNVNLASFGVTNYQATFAPASDLGYVVGAAFEKPDIALRVALSYFSSTTHAMDSTVFGADAGPTTIEMPQAVNLDFQTGVAANTLVFGQIRWAEWTTTVLNAPLYTANPLLSYDNDVITYSLGVGRKFNDAFSGAVTVGYEKTVGGLSSNLTPTDGFFSLGLGGTYTKGNMKVSAGVKYVWLGDAVTETLLSEFNDNTALGVGVKVAFTF